MKKDIKKRISNILFSLLVIGTIVLTSGFIKNDNPISLQESTEVNEEITKEEIESVSIEAKKSEEVEAQSEIEEPNIEEENQRIFVTDEEYLDLTRIVHAEAGGEDEVGKILVANVVLNRVKSERFPNTIKEVIYAPGQFYPAGQANFASTNVSEETRIAVNKALAGEDYSEGALYFCANYVTKVFARNTFLFQHGGHSFFI